MNLTRDESADMIANIFGRTSEYHAADLYTALTGVPTVRNGDGSFRIVTDPRVPEGKMLAFEPVIAHKDGKTFETMPPSAVLALQKMGER